MNTTKKEVKVNTQANKKITREDEGEQLPTLAMKKRVPTAFKVRQTLQKKK